MTKELAMPLEATIKGEWFRLAVEAQGDSLKECAEKMELSYPTTVYNHANGVSFMGAKLLAALAKVYPTINIHYVLTGIGRPILPPVADKNLTDDIQIAYEAMGRIHSTVISS